MVNKRIVKANDEYLKTIIQITAVSLHKKLKQSIITHSHSDSQIYGKVL